MPRYDDRHANTRLYVGHLASRTRSRDLEYVFSKYGRVRDVDMKRDYAFVEFSDPRDADDARYHLDGKDLDGSRIIVEFAKGVPRGSREYVGRGPPPGSGRCFNCGIDGHWARDCKAGDWKNKCYRCGERGHIERNCKNSPKKLSGRGRSYSRSPSPRRGRSRSPSYSRGRSYSRSRSPPPKRERSIENEDRSPSRELNNGVSSKGRKRSLSPDEVSLRPSSKSRKLDDQQDRSDYSGSPRRSRSPARKSPEDGRYRSPAQTNGRTSSRSRSRSHSHSRGRSRTRSRSRSPIPIARDDRSPDDYEDNRHSLVRSRSRSPRGSESP